MNNIKIKTKDRIIEAAGLLFSQQSYSSVTVLEICNQAECNIAAINYHFTNKENLYKQVLQLATEAASKMTVLADKSLSAEKRISNLIYSRLKAIMNPSPKVIFPQLIHQEMQSPSPIHSQVRADYLKPRYTEVEVLVEEFLGEVALPFQIQSATFSIYSQCAFLNITSQNQKDFWQEISNDTVITEMHQIILGGLIHYKSQLEVNR